MDLDLAGDLISAGAALSGLVLVFLGGVLNAYESYDTEQKNAVKARYKTKAWLCFGGFVAALLGTVLAFLAKVGSSPRSLEFAAGLEGVALILLFVMALGDVRSI